MKTPDDDDYDSRHLDALMVVIAALLIVLLATCGGVLGWLA
jgi:hypothetical protein